MTSSSRSEFADHLREMASRWKLILGIGLAAALLVGVYRAGQPESYTSTASVRLTVSPDLADDGATTEFQTKSLAEVARTPAIIDDAVERSGLSLTTDQGIEQVEINLRDTPGFIEIGASATRAEDAQALADGMAAALVDLVAVDASTANIAVLSVTAPARLPEAPTSPRPVPEGVLAGLVAALVTAEGLIVARKLRGRLSPVAPAADVERLLGVPTLHITDDQAAADAAAVLPFIVQHLEHQPIITVVQRGEMAEPAAANLIGRVVSSIHRRVLLVDAELGRPVLHESLGAQLTPGLSDVLEGRQSLGAVLQRAGNGSRAAVVSAGSSTPDGIQGRQRLVETRDLVRHAKADRVILSTTQNSTYDDALTAAHLFGDAVVLSLDPERVTTSSLRSMARDLRDSGANLAAVFLIDRPKPDARSSVASTTPAA